MKKMPLKQLFCTTSNKGNIVGTKMKKQLKIIKPSTLLVCDKVDNILEE